MNRGLKLLLLLGVIGGILARDKCEYDRCDDYISAFDGLTMDEINNVMEFMKGQKLSIEDVGDATSNMTYINVIDAGTPNKLQMLDHLDGNGTAPERSARVILYRGNANPKTIEEYRLWPLPDVKQMVRVKQFGKDGLDYKNRAWYTDVELVALDEYVDRELSTKLNADMQRLADGYTFGAGCEPKCLTWLPGMPGATQDGRIIYLWIIKKVEGMYLHPIGLQLRIHADSVSNTGWTIDNIEFRNHIFTNLDQLQAGLSRMTTTTTTPAPQPKDASNITRETREEEEEDPLLWGSLKRRGDPVPARDLRGPHAYMPDGQRYTITGQRVEWLGWRFNFAMRSISGMRLFDVRFRGSRLLYELKLSEMAAVYSGRSPAPQHTYYLDSAFLFGLESFELIKGVDCPCYADYFDFAHFFGGKATQFKNSACVFEWNMGTPLRRHYDTFRGEFQYFQGMPDNALIFRSILTVVNYEYIFDFVFHQNGAMEVVVSQSGYIAAHYYNNEKDDKYGFQLHKDMIGNLHHHIFNFKVDLDVLHRKNNFETMDLKMEAIKGVYTPYKEHSIKSYEMDAAYKYNFTTPKFLLFYNRDSNDEFGNHRAYRLLLNSPSYLMYPEDWPVAKSFQWARYQVAVTKRKEEEDGSSSIYNIMSMAQPKIQFQNFIDDNEYIINEDLVAWVTLGVHHVPHTEDIPIVQTTGAKNSFYLLPYNFFPDDPSEASRDNVRIDKEDHDEGGHHRLKYGGKEPEVTCAGFAHVSQITLICVTAVVCLWK